MIRESPRQCSTSRSKVLVRHKLAQASLEQVLRMMERVLHKAHRRMALELRMTVQELHKLERDRNRTTFGP